MITAATVIPLVGFALLPISALYVVLLSRSLRSRLGARVECFLRPVRFQFFGVMACAPTLIALNFIRDFDPAVRIAITGVGVLGFYIALHDMLFARLGGLYEKGLIWRGTCVFLEDIDLLERPDPYTVIIQTLDRSRITLAADKAETADRIAAHARRFAPGE